MNAGLSDEELQKPASRLSRSSRRPGCPADPVKGDDGAPSSCPEGPKPAAGDGGTPPPQSASALPVLTAEIDAYRERLNTASGQIDAINDGMQALRNRVSASFLTQEERLRREQGVASRLLDGVFDIIDLMDRLEAGEGCESAACTRRPHLPSVRRRLERLLEDQGIEPLDVRPGSRFVEREHRCVGRSPSGHPPDVVVEVCKRGWRQRSVEAQEPEGLVLRPTSVVLGDRPSQGDARVRSCGEPAHRESTAQANEAERGRRVATAEID